MSKLKELIEKATAFIEISDDNSNDEYNAATEPETIKEMAELLIDAKNIVDQLKPTRVDENTYIYFEGHENWLSRFNKLDGLDWGE